MRPRPIAPLSLDLDNKWSYLKTHGDASWQRYPTYLDTAVPRLLDVLSRTAGRITVFVVGKDADADENREAIAAVAAAGHEIGNHSYRHEPWLHLYEPAEMADELRRAHEAITEAAGAVPTGFRGPGFSLSSAAIEALVDLGYRYDATVFPNALNPVGRAYYFMTSNLSKEERRRRKALFGTFRDAFRPNRPFAWTLSQGKRLLEIPVTTMPGLRVPIHFSYLIYLAGFSERAADLYFRLALRLCLATRNPPSLLLHPLDFLGAEDEPELAFFPGMKLPAAHKLELVERFLVMLGERYELVPVGAYAASLNPAKTLEAAGLVR